MKKIFIRTVIIFFCASSCRSQNHGSIWTKAYENERYNEIYDGSKHAFPDDGQRKLIAQYAVEKLKLQLPDGIASVPADSVQKLYIIIMAKYVETHDRNKLKVVVPWTASGEKTLKESLLHASNLKNLDTKLRNSYCDCLIKKLKEITPDSMTLPPDSVFLKLIGKCNIEVLGRK